MNFLDRWFIKRINWIKPLDSLTLDELFKLQQAVGKAIARKLEIRGWEKKLGKNK